MGLFLLYGKNFLIVYLSAYLKKLPNHLLCYTMQRVCEYMFFIGRKFWNIFIFISLSFTA